VEGVAATVHDASTTPRMLLSEGLGVIITGVGHYVSLVAEGPGNPLWYTDGGAWSEDANQRKTFTGVQVAVRTPILGLPSGYRARLVCSEVEVVEESPSIPWCCH